MKIQESIWIAEDAEILLKWDDETPEVVLVEYRNEGKLADSTGTLTAGLLVFMESLKAAYLTTNTHFPNGTK